MERIPIAADSVEEINEFIATSHQTRAGDAIVIHGEMWLRASESAKVTFKNLCNVYGVSHRDGTFSSVAPFIERGV